MGQRKVEEITLNEEVKNLARKNLKKRELRKMNVKEKNAERDINRKWNCDIEKKSKEGDFKEERSKRDLKAWEITQRKQ